MAPGRTEPRGVVRVNSDLFEDDRPATATRFPIVASYGVSPEQRARLDTILDQLDWNELAALVEQGAR
ncbi:MAG: hypothetical protein ACOC3J_06530 [Gemmatimonadota bacterium]